MEVINKIENRWKLGKVERTCKGKYWTLVSMKLLAEIRTETGFYIAMNTSPSSREGPLLPSLTALEAAVAYEIEIQFFFASLEFQESISITRKHTEFNG